MSNILDLETQYQNLLETVHFEEGKPVIENVSSIGETQVKRVALKGGTELKCHKTQIPVLVLWLRGKARFDVNGEPFVMHPGSVLQMAPGTPHGATAETDCVFVVIKFQ